MKPIDLPDLRQLPDGFDCGTVAAEIFWDHFGIKSRPVPATHIDGTSPDVLESLLWDSGMAVQAGTMEVADLKHHTGRGRPVACCVTEPDGVGHWVVVGGVTRGRVRYQCPLKGPASEPVEAFEKRWADRTRRSVRFERWGIAGWLPSPL
jgi:hypothetical protein